MRVERVDSKTSLDEENNRTNRKSTLQKDDFNDRLNDLTAKVSYLEKMLAGSKTLLGD